MRMPFGAVATVAAVAAAVAVAVAVLMTVVRITRLQSIAGKLALDTPCENETGGGQKNICRCL